MEGWVKIHRKLIEWEWHDIPEMMSLLIHLLIMANHEDHAWHGIEIKKGQLVTGRRELSEKTGISEQTIRTCLSRLVSTNEITIKSTNRFSIITICNWDKYQLIDEASQPTDYPSNQPTTNQQLTSNQPQTRIKEYNNIYISSSSARAREGFVNGSLIPVGDVSRYIMENSTPEQIEAWQRVYFQRFGTVPDDGWIPDRAAEYQDQLVMDGLSEKDSADIFRHFTSFMRIKADEQLRNQTNNKNSKTDESNRKQKLEEMARLPENFSIYG